MGIFGGLGEKDWGAVTSAKDEFRTLMWTGEIDDRCKIN